MAADVVASFLGLDVPDPSTWSAWIWALHGLASVYLLGFWVAWFRFRAKERAVHRAEEGAVDGFNAAIQGFPWSFYAKMLAKHRYDDVSPRSQGPKGNE